jgi:archaemetzincin
MSVEEKKRSVYKLYNGDPWPKLGKPKPGDWLAAFDEPGQTLPEYRKSVKNRKTTQRNLMYIQPLGDFGDEERKLLEDMQEYSEIYFGCRTVLLEPKPLPRQAYNRKRKQYNASTILETLVPSVPKDALSLSAITLKDLYIPSLNFVFGLASLSNRVGVYSLTRYRWDNPDRKTVLKRSVKVMSHEIGHIFGMSHCIFYECIMCGSNSLRESDSRPPFLCPLCLDKLQWNLGLDVMPRYEELESYFRKHEMTEEADFIKDRINYLTEREK